MRSCVQAEAQLDLRSTSDKGRGCKAKRRFEPGCNVHQPSREHTVASAELKTLTNCAPSPVATASASTPTARPEPATPAVHAWRNNQGFFVSTMATMAPAPTTAPAGDSGSEGISEDTIASGEKGGEGGGEEKGGDTGVC